VRMSIKRISAALATYAGFKREMAVSFPIGLFLLSSHLVLYLPQFESVHEEEQRLLQNRHVQVINDGGVYLVSLNEIGLFKDGEVPGQGGFCEVEVLGDVASRHISLTEKNEDLPASGVCERTIHVVHGQSPVHYSMFRELTNNNLPPLAFPVKTRF
jgi:hypothetical protein